MSREIYTSTVRNGTMKALDATQESLAASNRRRFLEQKSLNPSTASLLRITYDRTDFCDYHEAVEGNSTIADALVTSTPGQALVLPLADCIGAVLYDPAKNVLMLSHLGRHSLEQRGGVKSVEYLREHYGCDPLDLHVYLSPAAGKANYPVHSLGNQGLHEIAVQQLQQGGVPRSNIDVSPIDTTLDSEYYSHSQFLAGKRAEDGRFAIVAAIR